MVKYVHLVGVEQIQIAANTMRSAASEINRAANTISEALNSHEGVMREFMDKMETMLSEGEKPIL
jgi:hypothetical protein